MMGASTEDSEFFDNDGISDDDVPEEAHKTLLKAVSQLYKKQRIDAPKRREAAQQISEFNLTSNKEVNSNKVHVNDLLKDLKEKVTHKEINKKVIDAQKKSKTLPKPLEKNVAEKVQRRVGFESVKKNLNKWNTIVERNRIATQLTFPLRQKETQREPPNFLTTFEKPSELEKAMAAVLNQSETAQEERQLEDDLSKLSVEEMIQRRRMMAKMKARESYRIAKAARQNKIKSKKYHRILKRERIKQELLDFEKLQKTDPEAALEKLEQIERARAEERISLRHRNTGKWAKSQAIRAKYNTEARVNLAEQLAKSRELTRKTRNSDSSSNEEDESAEEDSNDDENHTGPSDSMGRSQQTPNPANPWINEYTNFLKGCKEFSKKSEMGEENVSVVSNEKPIETITSAENASKEIEPLETNRPIPDDTHSTSGTHFEHSSRVDDKEIPRDTESIFVERTKLADSETTTEEITDNKSERATPKKSPMKIKSSRKDDGQKIDCHLSPKKDRGMPKNTKDDIPQQRLLETQHIDVNNTQQDTEIVDKILNEDYGIGISSNKNENEYESIPKRLTPQKSPKKTKTLIKEKNLIIKSPKVPKLNTEELSEDLDENLAKALSIDDTSDDDCVSVASSDDIPSDQSMEEDTVATNCGQWSIIETDGSKKKKLTKSRRNKRKLKEKSLGDLFDEAEEAIQNHTKSAVVQLKSDLENRKRVNRNEERQEHKTKRPKKVNMRGIDEALIEFHEDGISSGVNDLKVLKDKLNSTEKPDQKEPQIDPNKHIKVKTQKLFSEIGDIEEGDDDSDENEDTQRAHLMAAFADDDISADFRKEKRGELKKNQAEDINLEMPGWGSWAGTSLVPRKGRRKNRNLIIKMPKIPRRDENKPTVIINEDPLPQFRKQLVSELPYPYTSVKEYEASIRAPVGKNWVPERAHRKLTALPVLTRMGTIIEPMSNDVATSGEKKKRRIRND